MTRMRWAVAWAAILVAGSACSHRAQRGGGPAADYNTLTAEELSQRPFYSVYEAIAALRPNWFSLRGPTGAVQVYVDDNHLGGVEMLRTIRIPSVEVIRHIDGIQGAARYGMGHEGVILVKTRATGG